MSSVLGRGAGRIVGWWGKTRGRLYEAGVLSRVKLPVTVVSVGNLTVGGTGKTPVVRALAEFFRQEGRRVGIVSRNYKAQATEMTRVDPSRAGGAAFFGDEPFLLAHSLKDIPVFVGPRKSQTAAFALQVEPGLDLLLIDDGFQHQALERDFDLVLLDATDSDAFRPFPDGRGRESPEALQRADWFLMTKVNWVAPEDAGKILLRLPRKPFTKVLFHTQWPELGDVPIVGIFAGIARPEIFCELARKHYGARVKTVGSHRDHQVYGEKELGELRAFLRAEPRAMLVTTAKDAVKIEDTEIRERLRVAEIGLEWQNAEELFGRLRALGR